MKVDWKSIISSVAPTLATAVSGPLAGTAISAIGEAVLGKAEATETEVADAIATGQTEVLIRLRQVDAEFKTKMEALGIDLERMNATDRANARERETKLQDWTPRIIATLVTMGFFGTLAWMISVGLPATGADAILVMLGSLGTAWTQIVAYYYGSSAGSAEKNQLLVRLGDRQ